MRQYTHTNAAALGVLITLAILLAAPNVAHAESHTLPFGQPLEIPELGITVTFDSLMGDSRCPSDVVCFWEGIAFIRLTVENDKGAHSVPLAILGFTGPEDTSRHIPIPVLGFKFWLTGLQPYPISTFTPEPEDYNATVRIEPYSRPIHHTDVIFSWEAKYLSIGQH